MPIINCYISGDDYKLLSDISAETYRDIEELAEAAISEAINGYFRNRAKPNGDK